MRSRIPSARGTGAVARSLEVVVAIDFRWLYTHIGERSTCATKAGRLMQN
jgi:hypothetical protein